MPVRSTFGNSRSLWPVLRKVVWPSNTMSAAPPPARSGATLLKSAPATKR
nr:hypothetical protein [Lysobacter enzymogenes]